MDLSSNESGSETTDSTSSGRKKSKKSKKKKKDKKAGKKTKDEEFDLRRIATRSELEAKAASRRAAELAEELKQLKDRLDDQNRQQGTPDRNNYGDRRDSGRDSGGPMCYNCLQQGHISRNCTNAERCRICKGEGHRSYGCPEKRNNRKGKGGVERDLRKQLDELKAQMSTLAANQPVPPTGSEEIQHNAVEVEVEIDGTRNEDLVEDADLERRLQMAQLEYFMNKLHLEDQREKEWEEGYKTVFYAEVAGKPNDPNLAGAQMMEVAAFFDSGAQANVVNERRHEKFFLKRYPLERKAVLKMMNQTKVPVKDKALMHMVVMNAQGKTVDLGIQEFLVVATDHWSQVVVGKPTLEKFKVMPEQGIFNK